MSSSTRRRGSGLVDPDSRAQVDRCVHRYGQRRDVSPPATGHRRMGGDRAGWTGDDAVPGRRRDYVAGDRGMTPIRMVGPGHGRHHGGRRRRGGGGLPGGPRRHGPYRRRAGRGPDRLRPSDDGPVEDRGLHPAGRWRSPSCRQANDAFERVFAEAVSRGEVSAMPGAEDDLHAISATTTCGSASPPASHPSTRDLIIRTLGWEGCGRPRPLPGRCRSRAAPGRT